MAVPFLPLPQKLTPQAAADYLEGCVPPHRLPTWEPILAHLRAASPARPESGRPLAEVVATPLGLWLLRTVYIERNSDPAPLLHRERFPTPGALRDHLFDRLIDALIDARPPLDGPEKNADRFRPRRHRDPRQVRAWLGYLARLLSDQDTRDLAWWRLPTAVPAPASLFKYVTGFMGGLAAGLVGGLASGLTFGGHRAWSMYLVASWWWTWKNLLPRRLMPFLDDCHRLGLLRAIGPIYQFRHAEFQDYLAADHRRSHGAAGGRRAGEESASEDAGR
ncbi:hypothetical protein [Thermomonospora sp. CIF 1]|uniref:hypothetical protein n=1 Tax=Thermomonospora sp. CIF 1 TaxID=1916083 RepID=UPI00257B33FF|nr:hypothetical protein [Thermomonospora sp. CIF 1]